MSTEFETGLTVLGLYGENVKRVRAVKILPPRTGVVKIAGKNDSGKSSTLDLIQLALCGGKAQPTLPIRQGATSAKDVIDLQDATGNPALRVTRKWSGSNSYLTVERIGPGAGTIKSPQEFLDALCGAGLGFDPLAFVRLKPAQQVDSLLSVLHLSEDLRSIDAERQGVVEERTAVNRDIKSLKARVEAIPIPAPEVPDTEVSVATLVQERDALQAQRDAFAEGQRRVQGRLGLQDDLAKALQAAEREVGRLRELLARAETNLAVDRAAFENSKHALSDLVTICHALPNPDLTEITERIGAADGLNRAVRAKLERQQAVADLDAKVQVSEFLTAKIGDLDEKKRALLLGAAFPVPGLGFGAVAGEYTVTLHDIPLDQVSQSEQIRVGIALAMTLTPTVRVILLRDGSLLDADTQAEVERLAGARGYQVWCEIVGPGDGDAFVIEDGGVLREPKKG